MKHLLWLAALASLLLWTGCESPTAVGPPALSGDTITLASGLQYIEARIGAGTTAQSGDSVAVHYTGWLEDGRRFDTSRQPNRQALGVRIGGGRVIRGWEEGLPGMRVGGMRRLIIPPHLGYGEAGSPPLIPGDATLIFDVELMRIH